MSDQPHVIVVFRSRRRPEHAAAYADEAVRISELARIQPGHVEHRSYAADDGEHVTIVEFETMADVDAWREHVEHREAQRRGRSEFYAWYSISVSEVVRAHEWSHEAS
ncbi:MAG: antibiotic biosynthesis monooxygenase [Actinomycetota bacterium]